MNGYDHQALHAIQKYHAKHDNFPPFIEASAEHLAKMDCTEFVLLEPDEQGTFLAVVESSIAVENAVRVKQTSIPVVEVGAGDIVYKRLIICQVGDSQEQADIALNQKFDALCRDLARDNLRCLSQRIQGLYGFIYPLTYYSQMTVWVFGEQAVLEAYQSCD